MKIAHFPAPCGQTGTEVRATDILDSYKDDKALPERFREALCRNGKALEYLAAMSAEERRQVCQRAENCRSRKDMELLVDGIVGHEFGHPPYQS